MLIRPATPEDAAFLAKTILIAGRAHLSKGIWEAILGTNDDETLTFLHHLSITQIRHLFHYSCYLIAEDDGSYPMGSLGGYDPKISGYRALQQAIPEVVRKLNLAAQFWNSAEERVSRILSCLPEEITGAWVIDSVTTLPEHRRKGIAQKLLQQMLEKGRKQGYAKAQVNMYIGNEPALQLYRTLGFEIIEETRDSFFERHIGGPGMLSLAKNLS
jgi:ribosomal protein S18 acetylase RimI-like enzyme